jgi:hypothetical protein
MVSLQNITKSISAVALAAMLILTVANGNAEATNSNWNSSTLLRDGVIYEYRLIADRNRNPIDIEAEKHRVETIREISTQDKKGRTLASSTQKTVTDKDGNVLSDVKYEDKWIKDRNGRSVDIETEKHKVVETNKTIVIGKDGTVISETKSLKETLFDQNQVFSPIFHAL